MQDRLVFLIGSPRSGSTLLARMLGAHPAVHAPVEPHLMPPLAHLGYYETVEQAPYDPIITQRGLREFVGGLPRGEADFLDALRAFTDTLYGRSLGASGRRLFLDKTPAYALVLDFLARLYPEARYLVLTRHPLAVWSSYVDSFFDGDFEAAHRNNPLLERYVPAIARLLRERPVALEPVRYEQLVREPEAELRRLCGFLGLDFQPGMVDYGAGEEGPRAAARGLGDPITVARETRPTTRSVKKWAEALGSAPGRRAQAEAILARLTDPDLETWGYPRREIEADLAAAAGAAGAASRPRRTALTRYALERRALVVARRHVQRDTLGLRRVVRAVRSACDVLLR
jgi:hypothetical protein